MTESVRKHLPTIVVVAIIGIATTYLVLAQVLANAASLDVDAFSTWIFGVPCIVMFVCAAVIAATAHSIGRQLYLVVVAICLVAGLVCMVVTSGWLSDEATAALLLANSDADAVVTPILNSPILVLRDIAAFFVAPTVGLILGAWLGSRLHPMASESKSVNAARAREAKVKKKSSKGKQA